MHLPLLRLLNPFFQKHRSVLMYLFFGAVTTVISISTRMFFIRVTNWHELVAVPVSWVITVMAAFLTNRVWVFEAPTKGALAFFLQMLSFYGSRVATLILDEVIMGIFCTWLKFDELVVTVASSVIVVIVNYVFSKLFVFAKKKNKEEEQTT